MSDESIVDAISAWEIPIRSIAIPDLSEIVPTPIATYLSGEAAFRALKGAVDDLASKVPEDHDVLLNAFGISVDDVSFVEPTILIFRGIDGSGNKTSVVAHFTQLQARVVYLPKRGPQRVITGFAKIAPP